MLREEDSLYMGLLTTNAFPLLVLSLGAFGYACILDGQIAPFGELIHCILWYVMWSRLWVTGMYSLTMSALVLLLPVVALLSVQPSGVFMADTVVGYLLRLSSLGCCSWLTVAGLYQRFQSLGTAFELWILGSSFIVWLACQGGMPESVLIPIMGILYKNTFVLWLLSVLSLSWRCSYLPNNARWQGQWLSYRSSMTSLALYACVSMMICLGKEYINASTLMLYKLIAMYIRLLFMCSGLSLLHELLYRRYSTYTKYGLYRGMVYLLYISSYLMMIALGDVFVGLTVWDRARKSYRRRYNEAAA